MESVQQLLRCVINSLFSQIPYILMSLANKKITNFRCLQNVFDPDVERIFLQEDNRGPEILVEDINTMVWPNKLNLTVEEKKISRSDTLVFIEAESVSTMQFSFPCEITGHIPFSVVPNGINNVS